MLPSGPGGVGCFYIKYFPEHKTTHFLRDDQKQFGGNGTGLVNINCEDFGMRLSTSVSFSQDWKGGSLIENRDKLPLGISGFVAIPSDGSWVKYEISRKSRTFKNIVTARLFYANAPSGSIVRYALNNGIEKSAKLESGANLKELSLDFPVGTVSVKYTFNGCKGGYFYGVSFENGNGVYVDNFPIRGNNGVALGGLSLDILKQFNAKLNYKLIIVNFGVNIISAEKLDFSDYERQMSKVLSHLKEAFPGASILIIGVGDRAVKATEGKKRGRFATNSKVPLLLKSQQNIADKNGTAFWSLFEAIGGEDAIIDWGEAVPPLAEHDYTHFTHLGGKLVADLLFESLMNEMKNK